MPKATTSASGNDLPYHAFPDAESFENFLEQNHETSPGIWLKYARKWSSIPTITITESVEVGLCFGWINGKGISIDDTWYAGRWTPRRAKSIWSQINVNLVEKLTEQGKMRPAGIAAVEAAKADGRWARAYAAPSTITVPEDFEAELETNKQAKRFFGGLNKRDRYAVLWKIETTSPTTRSKRIEAMVEMLANEEVPNLGLKSTKKSVATAPKTGEKVDKKAKVVAKTKKTPTKGRIEKPSRASESTKQSLQPGLRSRARDPI